MPGTQILISKQAPFHNYAWLIILNTFYLGILKMAMQQYLVTTSEIQLSTKQ